MEKKPIMPGQPGYENPKFLRPGTGKPAPMPMKPGKPKPVAPRPVGNSGATTKPAIKPQAQIAAIEAMRKKQGNR